MSQEAGRETVPPFTDHLKIAWTHIGSKERRNIPKYIFRFFLRDESLHPERYFQAVQDVVSENEMQQLHDSFTLTRLNERERTSKKTKKDYKRTLNKMSNGTVLRRLLVIALWGIAENFQANCFSKIGESNINTYYSAVAALLWHFYYLQEPASAGNDCSSHQN